MSGLAVVVMGVSASGKSTVGRELASLRGVEFVDGDDLHPAANVAKMAGGIPLDDHDREPWLDAVGDVLQAGARAGGVVVACSALARRYRDRLRLHEPGVFFVHLDATADVLRSRARARVGHFMPPALLDSQLAALEQLEPDERGIRLDVALDLPTVARLAFDALP